MPGHSRSKNGVASLAYVPGISTQCLSERGHRHKAGDDTSLKLLVAFAVPRSKFRLTGRYSGAALADYGMVTKVFR
jgi:hypothetical protein